MSVTDVARAYANRRRGLLEVRSGHPTGRLSIGSCSVLALPVPKDAVTTRSAGDGVARVVGWFADFVNGLLAHEGLWGFGWSHVLLSGIVLALTAAFLLRMIHTLEIHARRWTAQTQTKWDDVVVTVLLRGARLILPLLVFMLVIQAFDLGPSTRAAFERCTTLALIGAAGVLVYQIIAATEESVLDQFRIDVKDNLQARKVYTQVKVLKKIAVVIVVIFTAASMLMVFDSVQRLGASILASAGVMGIVVGFAAQRSIAAVLGGFQIAMTQPIRLDDVVIIENEWGRIEEITLTYVVVLIWDQRRLVVPINYFIEKPFQNWTRVSADLLATVCLHLDYTVPLQALRDELDRLLRDSERWDGRVKSVQVTDAKPDGMEIRVLVSAPDASTAWDLRCELRERLIVFLQQSYPQCLPRLRVQLVPSDLSTESSTAAE